MEQAARSDDVRLRGDAQTADKIGGSSARLRGFRGGVNGRERGCDIGHDGPLSKECVLFWSASHSTRGPPARHARHHRREVTETAHENAERQAESRQRRARSDDPRGGAGAQPARPLPGSGDGVTADQATRHPLGPCRRPHPLNTQCYRPSSSFSMASICCSGKLELAAFGQGVRHLNLVAQVVAQARRALGHIDRIPGSRPGIGRARRSNRRRGHRRAPYRETCPPQAIARCPRRSTTT